MSAHLEHIRPLRAEELRRVLHGRTELFRGKDLLELGSGTGDQLRVLANLCRSAVGLDVAESGYSGVMSGNIRIYDGRKMPFSDRSFDVIFSSHVLEHLRDEEITYAEMRRVLRPGGIALHVVPTSHQRLWNCVGHYPDAARRLLNKMLRRPDSLSLTGNGAARPRYSLRDRIINTLIPPRHGEAGNQFTEYFYLRPAAWRNKLVRHGWRIESLQPLGMTYTGYALLGPKLGIGARSFLARFMGSASYLFIVRPAEPK
jgi:SAM-dependent methyltransferase